jgi:hypothetical protein
MPYAPSGNNRNKPNQPTLKVARGEPVIYVTGK